jgi:hypothetical protein
MDRYTNLNLYGHLALELGSDNNSGGSLTNVPTSDISFLRFTGSNPIVHGLDPGHNANNNKVLIITFLGTGSLTFKHLSTSNSSNNFRIKTPNGEDYTIPINYGSILIYDSYDNFWHIVGEAKLAAGSNGQVQFNNNGALRGNSNLTWDTNNNILNVSGTTYSTALFDNGKRVATLTGTETLENKTLVSPVITGTLTFGEIPFYQYGHHGISIFEDVDLSQSSIQTVYNFGTPDSEKSSVLALSVESEYRTFIGTAGQNSLNTFTIGSTSNNTNFQIRKGIPADPIDIVTGGTQLLYLSNDGQLLLPTSIQSTSHTTGTLVIAGGAGISGETFLNDHLNILRGRTLKFYDNDSSNYIGIRSPNIINSNYTLTLPANDGTSGQTLITNGSGTLTFGTIDLTHNNLLSLQGGGGGNYYHSNQPINISSSVQFAGLNINGAYLFPTSDGSNGQALITNGSGTLSFTNITQIHNDLTSIQGGGGGNYYHSNQPINTTNSVTFNSLNTTTAIDVGTNAVISGTLIVKGIKFPISDGSNGQVIQTDGSGNLTFTTPATPVGSVLDTYINTQKATINNSSTTTIYALFTETITGIYYFWVSTDPRIKGTISVNSDDLSNSTLETLSSSITGLQDNTSTLNVYVSSGNIVFQNNTGSSIVIVVRRETTPAVGGSTGISNLTIGTGLSGSLYNGTSNVTIAIDSSVVTLTGSQQLSNKTLTSPTITSPIVSGSTRMGTNTFTKNPGNGDITLDNGTTDTPGVIFYHNNVSNFGIDNFYNGSKQTLRFVKNLNESGGSTLGYIDLNGNFYTTGSLNPSTYNAGQVIKDTMLSNSEITVVSTTIAATSSNVDFITYSYTPVSSSSYLIVHIHISKYSMSDIATGNESWYSVLKADGNEIAYGFQKTTNAFRTGTLFPLTGRYTNTSTSAKTIAVAARRDTSDDSFSIDNSGTAIWLRITEVAR